MLFVLSNCSRIYRLFVTQFVCFVCFSLRLDGLLIIFHEHVASCVSGGYSRGPGKVSEIGRDEDVEDFVCDMEDLETVRWTVRLIDQDLWRTGCCEIRCFQASARSLEVLSHSLVRYWVFIQAWAFPIPYERAHSTLLWLSRLEVKMNHTISHHGPHVEKDFTRRFGA